MTKDAEVGIVAPEQGGGVIRASPETRDGIVVTGRSVGPSTLRRCLELTPVAGRERQDGRFNSPAPASLAVYRISGVHQGQVAQALRRVAQPLFLLGIPHLRHQAHVVL